jgi:hypothetical protein
LPPKSEERPRPAEKPTEKPVEKKPAAKDERLPPGPKRSRDEKTSLPEQKTELVEDKSPAPKTEKTPPVPLPERAPEPSPPEVSSLLPPGADESPAQPVAPSLPLADKRPEPSPPSSIDQLLPPGAAETSPSGPAGSKSSTIDAFLPPTAEAGPAVTPAAEIPLPTLQPGPLRPVLAPGTGGSSSLQGDGFTHKKPAEEDDPEVRKRLAQDKAKRRFKRNAILWTVCFVILMAVFWWMAR